MRDYSSLLIVLMAMVLSCALPLSALAAKDGETSEYAQTSVTETTERNTNGEITGRTVVTDTRVAVRQKTTEICHVDTNGVESLTSRKTETFDSLAPGSAPIEIVIEERLDQKDEALAVTSVITRRKTGTSSVTTYEERDSEQGRLVIAKRVTSEVDRLGQRIVTTETLDEHGDLVVTKRTTLSRF